MSDNKPKRKLNDTTVISRDVDRRQFMRGTGTVAGMLGLASVATACCDSDTGDPVRSDSDVTRSDSDPNDPIRQGDPGGSRSDSDVGDGC